MAHGGEEEKINIYPGLRLPADHIYIYELISSLMFCIETHNGWAYISPGELWLCKNMTKTVQIFFEPGCSWCGRGNTVVNEGVIYKRAGGMAGILLARRRASLSKCIYSRRIPKWQQRNFYFCPPDSRPPALFFLFVVLHGNQRHRVASIIHSPCTGLLSLHSPLPTQMQSRRGWFRLLLFHAAHRVYFFGAWSR